VAEKDNFRVIGTREIPPRVLKERQTMQIGIDSFAAAGSVSPAGETESPAQRLAHLLEEIELADQVGVDVFGIGEHHRREFLDSAPAVILAAAAARTRRIRLTSAVTVLSAADPVRVFQEFATLDLISQGRAEMIVGRGSFTEAFPLFGLDLSNYDSLFAEKLDLLLKIRANPQVHWKGKHRPALNGEGIYPRPFQDPLPIWLGVGGTPSSFVRAGALGLPLMVAIIGGEPHRFRPLIDLYREAGRRAGHAPGKLKVGLHSFGFLGQTDQQAADDFFPGYAEMFTRIGQERGWPPVTRRQFDAGRGPGGALLIGDAETVVEKVLAENEALGGIARLSFQMTVATLPHARKMQAIEILGTRVAPMIRRELGAGPGDSAGRPMSSAPPFSQQRSSVPLVEADQLSTK
jgi:probable LLM family oxidoreductase